MGVRTVLILVLILCLGTAGVRGSAPAGHLALYLLGMSVCNLVMLTGIVIYIAKMAARPPSSAPFCSW